MKNILSIDCEEAFCAHNMERVVPRETWDTLPLRIETNVVKLLELFDASGCDATFFILGWIAERLPHLVKEISGRGHEIATHGYGHTLLTAQTPQEFEADLRKALAVTQPLIEQPIRGYRAPSFTVMPKTTWAYTVMEQCGITYDSSVFPISGHPEYGFPGAPLTVHQVTPKLAEVPISVVDFHGKRFPATGGAYFRIFPYFFTRLLFKQCIKQGRQVVFYLHPWEIDTEQPRYPLPFIRRWRHYNNLGRTEERLRRMVAEFSFTSFRKALSQ
ncbi:MAG: XrtA system polysaccharide deacetylase [Chitinispirillaceae bacterium]|jgi:polysaccharide deacetylase family protein (PEP-CTERM system associated)